jgi:hypothetical protein
MEGVAPPQFRGHVARRGERPAEQLGQQRAQGVEVGAGVDGFRDGLPGAQGLQRPGLLRRHVAGGAAEGAGPAAGGQGGAGQVEVEQQRLAVAGQQHVARLEVQVNQPALVGVLEGVGQARAQPAHRRDVGEAGQQPARRAVAGDAQGQLGLPAVQRLQQVPAGAHRRRDRAQGEQHLGQGGAAEEGHGQHAQAPARQLVDEVDGHDVGVQQPGQRQVLRPAQGRRRCAEEVLGGAVEEASASCSASQAATA